MGNDEFVLTPQENWVWDKIRKGEGNFDPNIDYRRLKQLASEFMSLWMRLQALYLDAQAGFTFVRDRIEKEQLEMRNFVKGSELDSEGFQDTLLFSYDTIFADDFCTSGMHKATQHEAKTRNAPDGDNSVLLGQACLVMFYGFWNDYLRKEYVIAKGKLDKNESNGKIIETATRDHASNDLWGDIGFLRQSIVHNKGKATTKVDSCKLIKWFKKGDSICLTPGHMESLFLAFYKFHNELFKEQYPKHYIAVPKVRG